MIRAKMAEYLARAEKLKVHLRAQDPAKQDKPAAMGANGKAKGSGCVYALP